MAADQEVGEREPRVLVFSTDSISDPGIDLVGSSHMQYSPSIMVLSVPCSSCIRPSWVLHALKSGFDGVFIAADGTDCTYVQDCTERTARLAEQSQRLIEESGEDPSRLRMAAVCSVCAESFLTHMKDFGKALTDLGTVRKGESP
jgi:coenzyme F420-reducing hydrogenase delta subunit